MHTLAAIVSALEAANVNDGNHIYYQIAPEETPYPFVVVSFVSGTNARRDASDINNELWDVKAVSDSAPEAATLQASIRAALHNASLTLSGSLASVWCRHERDIALVEILNNQQIYHAGHTFRVLVNGV